MGISRVFFLALVYIIRLLPHHVLLSIGRYLGTFWYYIIPIRRKTVETQLKKAFGKAKDDPEIRAIARQVFKNTAQNALEFLWLNPAEPEKLTRLVYTTGMEHYYAAFEKGRGVLVLTAHFGNYDLLCTSQALAGHRLTILSKTIKPEWLNDFWMDSRQGFGVNILPDHGVKHELLRLLAKGETIGFVIDQHMPGKRGIESSFFGRPASTTNGLARLALQSGAPVVPIFIFRQIDGTHVMEVQEPIVIDSANNDDAIIHEATQRFNDILESVVRKSPEQWLWLHKRWKLAEQLEQEKLPVS